MPGVKVNVAEFFSASNLVVAGFSNGLFGLYEVPHFTAIHTLR
jgi:periodic tryptophan protein 2